METTRPLMRMGVADLEELFKEQSQNAAALMELDAELAQRRGTRALVLRERIRRTQKRLEADGASSGTSRSNSALTPPVQSDISGPAALSEGKPPASSLVITKHGHAPSVLGLQQPVVQQDLLSCSPLPEMPSPTKARGAAAVTPVNKPANTAEPEALPQLAIEDACRILRVSAGDAWEKVETARRKIVFKSSPLVTKGMPMTQVQRLLSEAQMANDAAIVIAARRSGRQ